MSFLKKLDKIYSTESLEKRFIARSLFWICLFVGVVFLIGCYINLREGDYLSLGIELFFSLYVFVGIPLLYKKKINFVSSSIVYIALVIGILIGVFSIEKSHNAVFISLVYLVPTLGCLSLLGGSVRQTLIIGAIIIAGLFYSYFFKNIPPVIETGDSVSSNLTQLVSPVLMGIVVIVFTSMVVYSTRHIISQLLDSESKSKTRLDSLSTFLESLKETINIGEDLNHSAGISLEITNTISQNLNSMKDSIENLQKQIESTQEIHKSIDKAGLVVKEGTETQSAAVEQSSTAIEEMSASIHMISTTAGSRKELIEHLIKTEKEVSSQIKLGKKSFDEVKSSSAEMLDVVRVISDIAARTNLLAMNAAIEAAHAGNSGRGFAVVAQEIRKLAVEAGSNSQKIKGIIENSIKGIDQAVEINSNVGNEFLSVSDQVKDIDIALSEIISGLSELETGTTEITKVVGNLTDINESVKDSVNEVTTKLGSGKESVNQISTATSQILVHMNDISENSSSIKSEAEKIFNIGKNSINHIKLLEENAVD